MNFASWVHEFVLAYLSYQQANLIFALQWLWSSFSLKQVPQAIALPYFCNTRFSD